MFERLKKFCDSFLEYGLPGFDIAIYKKGECVLRHMGGYSDLENKVKICGNEIYNIYSCSKIITCTAALMLYDRGLYSLEDKLSDFMPEFSQMWIKTEDGLKKAEKPILIKHLFQMTAGFSYDCASPGLEQGKKETDGKMPTREAMVYLAKEPLSFEPGEKWQYSLCHDVLAALVEVLSGEKFEDFVKKNIFDTLGMDKTTFMLPDEEIDSLAQQYRFENGKATNVGKKIFPYKLGSEYASGGAGGISAVDDFIKFLEGLRTGKLLKTETLKMMTRDHLSEGQRETYTAKETHGYGLGVRTPKGDKRYKDFGWGGAAGAYFAVDTEEEMSIYFASHIIASPVSGLRSMLCRFAVAEMRNGEGLEEIYEDLKKLHDYNYTY